MPYVCGSRRCVTPDYWSGARGCSNDVVFLFRARQALGTDFREQPHNVELAVGSEATLECRPPKGEPEPRVRWRKDNDPVKSGERWTITETGSLRIRDVRREDSGTYVCIAYNIGGEKDSNPARLVVRGTLTVSGLGDTLIY